MTLAQKTIEIEGYKVHYWEGGSGFPVLMLHGVGPGTSIVGNFGPVLEPMAERYRIVAADLIGFGDSQRKSETPYFDVDLWVRQGITLIDKLIAGECGIAGQSLGGALALKVAARCPQVTKVLTSCAIGAPYTLNPALDNFWGLPADRAALRKTLEAMVAEPGAVTDEMVEGRWDLLAQPGYAEYFKEMFAGDRQRFIDAGVITADEYARIDCAVTMLHGRNDQPCPAEETSLAVARNIPQAEVRLIGRCGHNLPREASAQYLAAARDLFG